MGSGTKSGLEVKGAAKLLAACGAFGFQLYCLVDKGSLLLLLFFFLCVCRVSFAGGKKLFCLKIFIGPNCLFLIKLVDWS